MADALDGFGGSTQSLSSMESGHVQRAFDLLGAKAQELAKITSVSAAAVMQQRIRIYPLG